MNRRPRPPFPLPTIILLAAVAPAVRAQGPELAREAAFVRGLVQELRFVEFAQHEVQQLRDRFDSPDAAKVLDHLAVDVSVSGAKVHPDREVRRDLFQKAITRSQRLIELYAGQAVAREAQRTLLQSCLEYGELLNEELELARDGVAVSEPLDDLEAAADAVYKTGLAAAREVKAATADDEARIQHYVAWMNEGILLRERARALPENRDYLANHAVEVLEELVLEVGEETALGQRALFELAQVAEVTGDLRGAIDSYRDTIDAIWLALTEGDPLPESVQRLMFDMMQEVYDRMGRVLLESGQGARVHGLVAEVRARIDEFRTEPHPAFGDSLALTQARVRARSMDEADVSAALATARRVSERHPHDVLGIRAKGLIGDILRSSGELVTAHLLLEVARGAFQEKDYSAAVEDCKRALRRATSQQNPRVAFDAWCLLARAQDRMQRPLESALAYSRALEDHAGDVADDALLRRTANRAARAMRLAIARADDPAVLLATKQKIDRQLAEHDPEVATASAYRQALRFKARKKYAEAAAAFARVEPSYDKYELALAHRVLSLFKAGERKAAVQAIQALREHVQQTPLEQGDRAARTYRKQALAWADYVDDRIGYDRYENAEVKDLSKAADLIASLGSFEATHGEFAEDFLPVIHTLLGELYIDVGDTKRALERYARLEALSANMPNAHSVLGKSIFGHYQDQIDRMETNESLSDEEESRLTRLRKAALDLGVDYARSVHPPNYAVLYNTMRLAEDLEDWPRCEWAAEEILEHFADAERSSLDQVRPVLGHALLRQSGRLREALDVLEAAEQQWKDDETKSTSYYEVLRFKAMALGGWPAMDAEGINYRPNPGLGKPDEAYEILWGREYRRFRLHSRRTKKFSLDWYRYYLQLCYLCRQAERIDSKFEDRGETFYNIARSTDDFATLKSLGARGKRLAYLFQRVRY